MISTAGDTVLKRISPTLELVRDERQIDTWIPGVASLDYWQYFLITVELDCEHLNFSLWTSRIE